MLCSKSRNTFLYLHCLFILSMLSACGGGGHSGSSSAPNLSAPSSATSSSSNSSSLTSSSSAPSNETLVIEENTAGFLSYFPSTAYFGIVNNHNVLQGLSNDATTNPAKSAYIDYSVNVGNKGNYQLRIQYAFGGIETNLRDAWIFVNGSKIKVDDDDVLEFPYTGISDGKFNTYAYSATVTVPLIAGDNDIRLVAVNTPGYTRTITYMRTGNGGTVDATAIGTAKGLANIDALEVSGKAPIRMGAGSTALYTLNSGVAGGMGSITASPQQEFYLPGTSITLNAIAAEKYQFDSWIGDFPSITSNYTIVINKNLNVAARFVPSGSIQPSALTGFGSIQTDSAIPYTLTGGAGANIITVSNLTELKAALSSSGPLIIKVLGLIDNSGKPSESLNVPSNTTLYGDTINQGHLKNIELKLSGENYIIRNLKISDVVAVAIKDSLGKLIVAEGAGNDGISINGGTHIWIDHCELYSTLTPSQLYDFSGPNDTADGLVNEYDAKDFYDGLIDLKNGASFITLSNNYLHDHWKAMLIGSSDEEDNGDSKTRITLHHNYLKNISSRIPLLRYGKGHFYNNYVMSSLPTAYGSVIRVDSIMNLRAGAQGLIEGNYVENAKNTFGYFYTTALPIGNWNLYDNVYEDVTYPATLSTGNYKVPYSYKLESGAGVKVTIPATAGVGVLKASDLPH